MNETCNIEENCNKVCEATCDAVREKNIGDYCHDIYQILNRTTIGGNPVEEIEAIMDKIVEYDKHKQEWFEDRLKTMQYDIEQMNGKINAYRTVLTDSLRYATRWD